MFFYFLNVFFIFKCFCVFYCRVLFLLKHKRTKLQI